MHHHIIGWFLQQVFYLSSDKWPWYMPDPWENNYTMRLTSNRQHSTLKIPPIFWFLCSNYFVLKNNIIWGKYYKEKVCQKRGEDVLILKCFFIKLKKKLIKKVSYWKVFVEKSFIKIIPTVTKTNHFSLTSSFGNKCVITDLHIVT